jgi:hypothetical protein
MSFQRTTADFWRAFEIQKSALDVSSLAFDGGMVGEAARLATAAFLLVGRGMRTHRSILDHLGIQESVSFWTTVTTGSTSGSPLISCAITYIRANEVLIELQPRGREAMMTGRSLTFDEWWNEQVLFDGTSLKLTRADIVRILRDKDGGAHYDANVSDPLVAAALRGEITGFVYETSDCRKSVPLALENCMRQIAEELRRTIKHLRLQHDPTCTD